MSDDHANRWPDAMRALTDGGVQTRDAVFRSAIEAMSIQLDPDVAAIGILDNAGFIETPVLMLNGVITEPVRYPIAGTPCYEVVYNKDYCHYDDVAAKFPDDPLLVELGAETYFGHLIRTPDGVPRGHIFVLYRELQSTVEDTGAFLALLARWCARELAYLNLIEEAKAAQDIGRDLLAMVNHEIRTPLNAIIGFSELLRSPDLSPDLETTRSYGSMIHDSGRMLLWTLDRVIFTNTMANDEALDLDGLIDVEGLCERLREAFLDRAPAAASIDVRIGEGAQQITGDEDGLRRALEELLDNALKHTSKDGHIELAFTVEGPTRVRISVTDDGPGIPADEVSRLLLPFQQRETGYTRHEGGAGLGLHLVRRVVTAHKSNIEIRDAEGGGTVVSFTLPRHATA